MFFNQKCKAIMELTIEEKYKTALLQLRESNHSVITVSEKQFNIQEELDSLDIDVLRAKLQSGLSNFKKGVIIPLHDFHHEWESGIYNGDYTDTILNIKSDGGYTVHNSMSGCTEAFDEDSHINALNDAKILDSMIQSVEVFTTEYFNPPVTIPEPKQL